MCRRKIDWRMLPLLALIASVALIDRANLGVARISGMESDLVRILNESPVFRTFDLTTYSTSTSTSGSGTASPQ